MRAFIPNQVTKISITMALVQTLYSACLQSKPDHRDFADFAPSNRSHLLHIHSGENHHFTSKYIITTTIAIRPQKKSSVRHPQDHSLISSKEGAVLGQLRYQKLSCNSSQSSYRWNWLEEDERETKSACVCFDEIVTDVRSLYQRLVSEEKNFSMKA